MSNTSRIFTDGFLSRSGPPPIALSGASPRRDEIIAASNALARQPFFVDDDGYECDMFAASISDNADIAYLQSRAKCAGNDDGMQLPRRHVDISIRLHIIPNKGQAAAYDIRSYNPFSGCAVRHFQWIGQVGSLVYREKHRTYACRFGDCIPPRFVEIADRWVIVDDVLAYIPWQSDTVLARSYPQLDELASMSLTDATLHGLLPTDPGMT